MTTTLHNALLVLRTGKAIPIKISDTFLIGGSLTDKVGWRFLSRNEKQFSYLVIIFHILLLIKTN
jgi:hypothetical protein